MKHFIMWFFALVLLFVWMYILENIVGLNLKQLKHDNGILYCLLVISPSICFFCTYLVYFTDDNPEETPKEKTKTENLKTDNPEDNEIITVTEIKGERNIIIDVVVKIIVFIIGLVLTGFLTSFLRYTFGLSGVFISILGFLPLIFAIQYCFTTNDKNKDKE